MATPTRSDTNPPPFTRPSHAVTAIRQRPVARFRLLGFYGTAIGKKYVMAVTGIGLLGFVVAHMIGNLHLYEGPEQVHDYAEALRDLGGHLVPRTLVLWLLRIGLIAMFAAHIHAAVSLTRMSRRADRSYVAGRDYIAADFAGRTMRWTGPIVALYVLFHLADLTWGWWLGDDFVRGDVYHNVYESMSYLPVAIIYIFASAALAVHIFHGARSMFRTLGMGGGSNAQRWFARGVATVVLVGNLSFPIAVQTGLINEESRTVPIGGFATTHETEGR